jgi:hypothetical protein
MAHRAHDAITQEAFSVAPDLIGLPLARPMRRAAAMAVDLLCVGLLVNVGGGTVFGLALVWVLFRLTARPASTGTRRMLRLGMRGVAALTLLVVAQKLWHRAEKGVSHVAGAAVMGMVDRAQAGPPGDGKKVMSGLGVATGFVQLQNADDADEARPIARRVVDDMRRAGLKDREIRSTLEQVAAGDSTHDWMASVLLAAADSAGVRRSAPAPVVKPDSLALAYAGALRTHDTAGARRLRLPLGAALAADTLHRLEGKVTRLSAERDAAAGQVKEMREQSEAVEKRGLLHLISTVADELGLSFGWVGLYFTAFLALWKGQTPGKRMAGIRVVRLDGEKITLWAAFERFGGYAASIFTGLLGFAQIFWDKNRQALHDKISETVVVRA